MRYSIECSEKFLSRSRKLIDHRFVASWRNMKQVRVIIHFQSIDPHFYQITEIEGESAMVTYRGPIQPDTILKLAEKFDFFDGDAEEAIMRLQDNQTFFVEAYVRQP
jgi:hypothetical protein